MGADAELRRWIPRWWNGEVAGPAGWAARIATGPAELMYRGVVRIRNRLYDRGLATVRRAGVPVISVGNISVGGTGKTPVTAWIAARLRIMGRTPAVVLRGYGRDEVDVHREVDPGGIVVANPDRLTAVGEAVQLGADCAVLDDGFQHRALFRDLDIVLVAAERWGGSLRLLPRGPWREPAASLARADHVLVTRKTTTSEEALEVVGALRRTGLETAFGVIHLAPGPLVPLASSPNMGEVPDLRGARVLAVSSIADPRPFHEHLQAMGMEVDAMAYPDHHEFTTGDLEAIERRARASSAVILTRKEAVKLRPMWRSETQVYMLEQSVIAEAGAAELERSLRRAVGMGDE